MTDFNRKTGRTNYSAGATVGSNTRTMNALKELQKQKQALLSQPKQEDSLRSVDVVVGRPKEKIIPRDALIPAPKEWNFFPAANKGKILEMSESIRQYGLLHNITVWEQDDGKYMILGGHTRVACFDYLSSKESGESDRFQWQRIPALVYAKDQITEIDAKRIVIVSNTDQRELTPIVKAKAYQGLFQLERKKAFYGRHLDTLSAAAEQANTSRAGFSRYLNLMRLIPDIQRLVDDKTITIEIGQQIGYLPKDLQQYIFDNNIYEKLNAKNVRSLRTCVTVEDIDNTLTRLENTSTYNKYNVYTLKKKPTGSEIFPLFVKKGEQEAIRNKLVSAVECSTISDEDKQYLLDILCSTKK